MIKKHKKGKNYFHCRRTIRNKFKLGRDEVYESRRIPSDIEEITGQKKC
jgi:hypothetical protein